MILLGYFFISWRFLTKRPTIFTKMSLRFSINSLKCVHFWTLLFNTVLILITFPFQRYISCRHLTFDTTYENGCHGDFPLFWKWDIGASWPFCGLHQNFSGSDSHIRMWNKDFLLTQKFLRDSIIGLGL